MSFTTYHLIETAVVTAGVALALASAARMAWQRWLPKGKRAGGGSDCAPACGGGACAGCGSGGTASHRQPAQATVQWHPRRPAPGGQQRAD